MECEVAFGGGLHIGLDQVASDEVQVVLREVQKCWMWFRESGWRYGSIKGRHIGCANFFGIG
jgi:hypothetical protein